MNTKIFYAMVCLGLLSCNAMQGSTTPSASSTTWSKIKEPIAKIVAACKQHPVVATMGMSVAVLVIAYTTCEQFRRYVDVMVGLRPSEEELKRVEFVFDPEEFLKILQEREQAGQPIFVVPLDDLPADVAQEQEPEQTHPA